MNLFEEIKNSILEMDPELTVKLTGEALDADVQPIDIVNKGLVAGIEIIGDKFKEEEIYLPEVMMAAKAFKAGFMLVAPKLKDTGYEPKGLILLGSVQGDTHDIGKNIVLALLQGNGFEIIDAGVNVTPSQFVELVREKNPNVIGMSSLLTTTMAKMPETIKALEEAGLRSGVKIIIGGAPVSAEYAKKIGADGYGEDASEAVEIVKSLLGKK